MKFKTLPVVVWVVISLVRVVIVVDVDEVVDISISEDQNTGNIFQFNSIW